jgi:hypothetical protein
MMKPAQNRHGVDPARIRADRSGRWHRNALTEAVVGPHGIEIAKAELFENASQVVVTENPSEPKSRGLADVVVVGFEIG